VGNPNRGEGLITARAPPIRQLFLAGVAIREIAELHGIPFKQVQQRIQELNAQYQAGLVDAPKERSYMADMLMLVAQTGLQEAMSDEVSHNFRIGWANAVTKALHERTRVLGLDITTVRHVDSKTEALLARLASLGGVVVEGKVKELESGEEDE